MSDFTISEHSLPDGKTRLIKLNGTPLEEDFSRIQQEFTAIQNSGEPHVVLDIAGLQAPTSEVLGLFLDFGKQLEEKRGKLVLASPNQSTLDLIELLGVKSAFTFAAPAKK